MLRLHAFAFPLAEVAVAVGAAHPAFMPLLLARLHQALCCVATLQRTQAARCLVLQSLYGGSGCTLCNVSAHHMLMASEREPRMLSNHPPGGLPHSCLHLCSQSAPSTHLFGVC